MIRCLQCERKIPKHIEVCPTCGAATKQLIKEPEDHGIHYLEVNTIDIPNDC